MLRIQLYGIDNPDDSRIYWAILAFGGHARRAAGYHQDSFAKPGGHRVHGDQITRLVSAFGRNGLNDQQFFAFEPRIFARGNNRAHDARQNHSFPPLIGRRTARAKAPHGAGVMSWLKPRPKMVITLSSRFRIRE